MQQTKKFKMADAISPYLAVSCGLTLSNSTIYVFTIAVQNIHVDQTHLGKLIE